jgi:hypothetical protein
MSDDNQDMPDSPDDSGSRSPICSPPIITMTFAACECLTWGRDTTASMLHLEHHPNCELYEPEPPIRELLLRLIDGIEEWAADEDGIHEACWNAYQDACCVLGQYDRPSKQEPV